MLLFCRGETSAIQAFSFGATSSIMIVAHIMANLISFITLLEFANRTVEWFGIRAGVQLTLEVSLLLNIVSICFLSRRIFSVDNPK